MSKPANDDNDGDGDGDGPPRAALVALAVIAVLIVGGIWLAHTLHSVSRLQDCVMAGRTNCAPVTPRSGG